MEMIKGYHLTATERKMMKAIMNAPGASYCKTRCKQMWLTQNEDGTVSITVKQKERPMCGSYLKEVVRHFIVMM